MPDFTVIFQGAATLTDDLALEPEVDHGLKTNFICQPVGIGIA
jgi:hypothetical protein